MTKMRNPMSNYRFIYIILNAIKIISILNEFMI